MADETTTTDENLDNEVDEVEEQETEEQETEYVAPSKEEWAETQAALKKANDQAKKYRLAAKGKTPVVPAEDADEKVTAARKEVEDVYRPKLVRSALKSSFADAGVSGNVERLLKLVDTTELELDDNGDLDPTDVEELIDGLKADFPELFPTTKARPGKIDSGRRADGGEKKLTASERQAIAAGVARRS